MLSFFNTLPDPKKKKTRKKSNVNAIVVFNMAVWLTRTKKYVPAAIIPDPKEAANSIAREAASLASSLYSSRNSSSSKYGNAKNRSHEQELAAVK